MILFYTAATNLPTEFKRIYSLDMTNISHNCPTSLKLHTSDGMRLCGRKTDGATSPTGRACDSVTISTNFRTYEHVRGQITAYMWGATDAFKTDVTDIDDSYVDGISITYGQNPRNHIWTFAAGAQDYSSSAYNCPGIGSSPAPPDFVTYNYFCSSSYRGGPRYKLHTDPLWTDGVICKQPQCPRSGPRIFCAKLSQVTAEDLEIRVCADLLTDEDIRIQKIDLYID